MGLVSWLGQIRVPEPGQVCVRAIIASQQHKRALEGASSSKTCLQCGPGTYQPITSALGSARKILRIVRKGLKTSTVAVKGCVQLTLHQVCRGQLLFWQGGIYLPLLCQRQAD